MHSSAFQCYYCNNVYGAKLKSDKHIENCSGIPGIVYNYNTQNVVSFEENIGYKGDLPLAAYLDFETTAPTDNSFNPRKKRIFVVSYVIVFAFHPTQNFDRTVVQGSFGYSYKILTTIDYLTND